jgi:NAD(P)-dependent dehydrogenase (short-subunit alcohol dehydrogenase family)
MKAPANNKKIVLISGAASGIGRTIAERYLAQGDSVHICDASAEKIDEFLLANPDATGTKADIGARHEVDQVFADLEARHGGLNILINNAGVAGPSAPVEELDEDGWDRCIRINLSGTFYMTRRAVPLLKKQDDASIINIASTAALFGYPLRSPYAASKWAQIGLTKTWAMELGPAGIRVNAVCPTSVSGPRIEAVIRRDAEQRGLTPDEIRHVYQRHTSMRTFVTADEVADTVLFLSSEQASKISGQSIAVDGHTEGLSNWLD